MEYAVPVICVPVAEDIIYQQLLGYKVRVLRMDLGLSQSELSSRRGIATSYLSRIESGSENPSLLVFVAIAMTLKTDPKVLLEE